MTTATENGDIEAIAQDDIARALVESRKRQQEQNLTALLERRTQLLQVTEQNDANILATRGAIQMCELLLHPEGEEMP